MKKGIEIDILLATYNGEQFLRQQIDSILGSEGVNFRIIARDDCSSDSTNQILIDYALALGDKFVLVKSEHNLGVKENFSELLKHSKAPYIAFSDQDDIWLPEKLLFQLNAIKVLECKYGSEVPLLVHSDLMVIDIDSNLISRSFWMYQRIDPLRDAPNYLLVQNNVTGCTIMCNQRLVHLATPIPTAAIMHDHWLAMITAVFGHIKPIHLPLVKYRKHPNNSIGPKKYSTTTILKSAILKFLNPKSIFNMSQNFSNWDNTPWTNQSKAFNDIFGNTIPDQWKAVFEAYSSMNNYSWFVKRIVLFKYKLWAAGFFRKLYYFMRV